MGTRAPCPSLTLSPSSRAWIIFTTPILPVTDTVAAALKLGTTDQLKCVGRGWPARKTTMGLGRVASSMVSSGGKTPSKKFWCLGGGRWYQGFRLANFITLSANNCDILCRTLVKRCEQLASLAVAANRCTAVVNVKSAFHWVGLKIEIHQNLRNPVSINRHRPSFCNLLLN